MTTSPSEPGFLVDDVWVFLVLFCGNPHLRTGDVIQWGGRVKEDPTFLKVLNPAKIDPPIHVEYFRSGGA
jgi:hypothetical protein